MGEWGSPQTRGAFLVEPIARIIVFVGLYGGPPSAPPKGMQGFLGLGISRV